MKKRHATPNLLGCMTGVHDTVPRGEHDGYSDAVVTPDGSFGLGGSRIARDNGSAGPDCIERVYGSLRRNPINMFNIGDSSSRSGRMLLHDPPIARFLFQSTAASWLWLVVRLFVGYQFLTSGWGKLAGGKWLDGSGGSILTYWQNA